VDPIGFNPPLYQLKKKTKKYGVKLSYETLQKLIANTGNYAVAFAIAIEWETRNVR
jgi:hypothetical protein